MGWTRSNHILQNTLMDASSWMKMPNSTILLILLVKWLTALQKWEQILTRKHSRRYNADKWSPILSCDWTWITRQLSSRLWRISKDHWNWLWCITKVPKTRFAISDNSLRRMKSTESIKTLKKILLDQFHFTRSWIFTRRSRRAISTIYPDYYIRATKDKNYNKTKKRHLLL